MQEIVFIILELQQQQQQQKDFPFHIQLIVGTIIGLPIIAFTLWFGYFMIIIIRNKISYPERNSFLVD